MTTTPDASIRRKLIEVSIPLEDINAESSREKSIRHGHPSTLHLWWARRPLAAARAVLFAQLVDDPSSNPELTEEQQKVERERLHGIIRRLVRWENVSNETLLREAHAEILRSTGGVPPAILDPFAGGGTIPLEAQRLGLEAHASDLNPVAVLINKALIEIPPKFAGQSPVFPGAAGTKLGAWPRATGLAEDVRRYGAWMREQAKERIGHLYPDVTMIDEKTKKETKATAIAWIWARTVTCPNPACAIEMPLVRSWWLGKKKGKEAYVVPAVVEDADAPSGRRVEFSIGRDRTKGPAKASDGTVGGGIATCVACQSSAPAGYLREQARSVGLGKALIAVVAAGKEGRLYSAPTEEHYLASVVDRPERTPDQKVSTPNHDVDRLPMYGMPRWSDAFTNRQLVALTTLSDIVGEVREQALKHAVVAGLPASDRLADGGTGAEAYADAIATYVALAISRMSDRHSSMTTWDNGPAKEYERAVFSRHAISMAWDFVESNPFGGAGADVRSSFDWLTRALGPLPCGVAGEAIQADAATRPYARVVVSTDPPYYDNIGYSDLSDYFYVWLRRSLRDVFPSLLATMLVPKAEELVANQYRHGGKEGAERFFETGFEKVFNQIRTEAPVDFPIAVFYAFKQAELNQDGIASTGWATILTGMIKAGWAVTATWPIRTEMSNRLISIGTNALASSIVLVLRPRHETAGQTTRRGFLAALRRELPKALEQLRQGAIAPVDLTQATIGPGMAVFSSFTRVVENDGSDMSVKAALRLINGALDEVLADGEGDLDPDTRFCLKWYEQYGWDKGPFGDADLLARSYDTSVRGVADSGVLMQGEGIVQLIAPADLPLAWNPVTDARISVWELMCHLARVLSAEDGGLQPAAKLLSAASTRSEIDIEAVQRLSYRLYEMTKASRTNDARLFNLVGGSWTDLTETATRVKVRAGVQAELDYGDDG